MRVTLIYVTTLLLIQYIVLSACSTVQVKSEPPVSTSELEDERERLIPTDSFDYSGWGIRDRGEFRAIFQDLNYFEQLREWLNSDSAQYRVIEQHGSGSTHGSGTVRYQVIFEFADYGLKMNMEPTQFFERAEVHTTPYYPISIHFDEGFQDSIFNQIVLNKTTLNQIRREDLYLNSKYYTASRWGPYVESKAVWELKINEFRLLFKCEPELNVDSLITAQGLANWAETYFKDRVVNEVIVMNPFSRK